MYGLLIQYISVYCNEIVSKDRKQLIEPNLYRKYMRHTYKRWLFIAKDFKLNEFCTEKSEKLFND